MTYEYNQTLALLIDGDNVTGKIVDGLLSEIANYGTASVKRIYGDWTKPNLNGWKACLLEHSIQPVQQFAYTTGKNATDGALPPFKLSIRPITSAFGHTPQSIFEYVAVLV